MSRQRTILRAFVLFSLLTAFGCDSVDLKTAIEVVDVSSGYYDDGLTPAGMNHLVPSVTFSLRNKSGGSVSSVDMIVMYWAQGQDAEQDEALIKAIGGSGLPAGATSDPIVSRSRIGFSMAAPRAELFSQRAFVEWSAKLFLKRGGKIVPAGEYKIDHRILLSSPATPK
jgi:hypothetical protein